MTHTSTPTQAHPYILLFFSVTKKQCYYSLSITHDTFRGRKLVETILFHIVMHILTWLTVSIKNKWSYIWVTIKTVAHMFFLKSTWINCWHHFLLLESKNFFFEWKIGEEGATNVAQFYCKNKGWVCFCIYLCGWHCVWL